ncbi:MAG: V-type ATP synthase subunit K [Spirochaetaceae bacterium]|nr:V-type ATP synthase subunit K [Spirochaetaceae bacterium]
MDITQLGIGAVFAIASAGSAYGFAVVGQAVIGAWKKCYAQNKPAPFILMVFFGMPFSQVIYSMILMNQLHGAVATTDPGLILGAGLFGGVGMALSAWSQGVVAAAAADSYAATGKGFVNYIILLGVIESVALFIMVFLMGILG